MDSKIVGQRWSSFSSQWYALSFSSEGRELSSKMFTHKGNCRSQCIVTSNVYFRGKKYLDVKHPKKAKLLLSENGNNDDKLNSLLEHYSGNIGAWGPLQITLPVRIWGIQLRKPEQWRRCMRFRGGATCYQSSKGKSCKEGSSRKTKLIHPSSVSY